MTKEEKNELEEFIHSWHYDKKSHRFALKLGLYLFQFIDELYCMKLADKTIRKHIDNCWIIGILECDYGDAKTFVAEKIFNTNEPPHEYEFSRKFSDSNYALNSYKTTWNKLCKYTKAMEAVSNK